MHRGQQQLSYQPNDDELRSCELRWLLQGQIHRLGSTEPVKGQSGTAEHVQPRTPIMWPSLDALMLSLPCRVTWLLERVNELAHGEVLCLSKATLDSSSVIAQDFALIRPILDTLLLSRVSPVQRMDSFSRTLSAPLQVTMDSATVCSAVRSGSV